MQALAYGRHLGRRQWRQPYQQVDTACPPAAPRPCAADLPCTEPCWGALWRAQRHCGEAQQCDAGAAWLWCLAVGCVCHCGHSGGRPCQVQQSLVWEPVSVQEMLQQCGEPAASYSNVHQYLSRKFDRRMHIVLKSQALCHNYQLRMCDRLCRREEILTTPMIWSSNKKNPTTRAHLLKC